MEAALRPPDAVDVFETLLVPAMFERYARELVGRARPIGPADRILDLGCGTGIVARILRERLGGAARIAGLDVSAAMIAKAQALAPEIDWHVGNAMSLPFADGDFDVVLSQQMLQFVPDRVAAVREMRRVLAPRGRLLVSTWRPRPMQPLHDALGRVAETHLGASADKRWSLDGDTLAGVLLEAGFVDVRIETASLIEEFRRFPVRMSAMAAGFDLASLSDEEKDRRLGAIEQDSAPVLAKFSKDGVIAAPSVTNVAIAIAP